MKYVHFQNFRDFRQAAPFLQSFYFLEQTVLSRFFIDRRILSHQAADFPREVLRMKAFNVILSMAASEQVTNINGCIRSPSMVLQATLLLFSQ